MERIRMLEGSGESAGEESDTIGVAVPREQLIRQQLQGTHSQLAHLVDDFTAAAKMYGKVIISELPLAVSEKTGTAAVPPCY